MAGLYRYVKITKVLADGDDTELAEVVDRIIKELGVKLTSRWNLTLQYTAENPEWNGAGRASGELLPDRFKEDIK